MSRMTGSDDSDDGEESEPDIAPSHRLRCAKRSPPPTRRTSLSPPEARSRMRSIYAKKGPAPRAEVVPRRARPSLSSTISSSVTAAALPQAGSRLSRCSVTSQTSNHPSLRSGRVTYKFSQYGMPIRTPLPSSRVRRASVPAVTRKEGAQTDGTAIRLCVESGEYLCTQVPIPPRDFTSNPVMIIIRSFDVNRPGEEVVDLKGGVAGGSILKGVLKMGDEIEIRPGIVTKDGENVQCRPIRSRIMSLLAEKNALQFAVPGGLIGVGTKIDPKLTRADKLVGHVLGHPGKLPSIYTEIEVKFYLLRRLLGVKTEGDGKAGKVAKLKKGEILMVNIGSTAAGGRVRQGAEWREAPDSLMQMDEATLVALMRGHWSRHCLW
eukprot:g25561.t1